MKAVVLAGGYATRLWPITKQRPKMFLPVGDSVVIDRIFEELEEDDRISEVYISTNERFAEDFEEHIDGSPFEKPQLSIEDTEGESEKFGVVGALGQLVEREEVEEELLVIAGDNLISFEMSDFIDRFEETGETTIAAYDVGSAERAKSYGIVDVENDRVVDFQEKPDDPESTLASIACYAFPAEALAFEEYLENDNNPDEPGWYIEWLTGQREVYCFRFDGAWFDIGTADSYIETVEWALEGDSLIAEDATIENSEIGTGVHVMDGATVRDSTLDHTIVFPNTVLENCHAEGSIVDREADISGLELDEALIGEHTRIPER